MTGFECLTEAHCIRAADLLAGVITTGPFKRKHGFLLVLDPLVRYDNALHGEGPTTEAFEDAFLFRRDYGDPGSWEHDYTAVARAKAWASWKTGLSSLDIRQQAPYLYEHGMTKWGGSIVLPGGLVIAFSGFEEYFDQMICEMMGAAIKGLCLHEARALMEDGSITFLDGLVA